MKLMPLCTLNDWQFNAVVAYIGGVRVHKSLEMGCVFIVLHVPGEHEPPLIFFFPPVSLATGPLHHLLGSCFDLI